METLRRQIDKLYIELKEQASFLPIIGDVKRSLLDEIEKCHIASYILYSAKNKEELSKMYEYMCSIEVEIEKTRTFSTK